VVALVTFAHWMLRRRSLRWSDVGLNRPSWPRFLVALAAGMLIVVVFAQFAQAIIARFGLPAPNYSMFAPVKGSLGEYIFWVLPVTVGTAAFGQELMFRGFLMDALQRLCGGASGVLVFVTAVTVQAVIFGGLHFYQGVGGMIIAGATGLALGLTWLIAGRNLWAGIVIHALLDGSAMTAIHLGYVTT
jgi:membrane protease YdiL (CAAX protease family)